MIRFQCVWTGLVFGLLLALVCGERSAASTDEDPEAPLAVRPEDESRKLQKEAESRDRKARAAVTTFREKLAEDRLSEVKAGAVGDAHVAVLQLDRLARRLILLGEPAGRDFSMRMMELRAGVTEIVGAYLHLPGVPERIARDYEVLQREAQKRRDVLDKARALGEREEWEKAESILHEAIDDLEKGAVWLGSDQRRMVLGEFAEMAGVVAMWVRRIREERAQAALAEAREAQTPDFDALLGEIRSAASSVQGSSAVEVEGQSLTGPEFLERFGQRWQEAQHQAVRCRGLDWARRAEAATQASAKLTSQHARFSAEVGGAVAALIEADAARADASAARGMLAAYLEQVAQLVALSGDDSLESAVGPVLEKLATKSPELAAEVEAYRKATTDVLRWRRRTAEASARARKDEFPPIQAEFFRAVQATDSTPGLVPAGAVDTSRAEFSGPVPSIMGPAAEKLMGRRVSLADLVGLPTKSRITIARYGKRSYARFSVPDALAARFAERTAALERDLLVSESAPPLTLEAAVALARARRGDLAAAGGEITGVTLESLVTRFATLSSAGRTLIPLGPLPQESGWRDVLRQAVMQFEIEPAWVRHECFFVGGE
ncbi:MAG: hypothetical protein HQ582_29735 [Planctomycetes bacterium]|nr:hypothetical protein [Planctomycetota bacterium]